jgi:hypothetical protein
MKFIKNYNLFNENANDKKYEIGDYIIVTSDEYDLVNKILIIYTILSEQDPINISYLNIKEKFNDVEKTYVCHEPKINDSFYEIEEKDIIRKLTEFEIKAIKYNIL